MRFTSGPRRPSSMPMTQFLLNVALTQTTTEAACACCSSSLNLIPIPERHYTRSSRNCYIARESCWRMGMIKPLSFTTKNQSRMNSLATSRRHHRWKSIDRQDDSREGTRSFRCTMSLPRLKGFPNADLARVHRSRERRLRSRHFTKSQLQENTYRRRLEEDHLQAKSIVLRLTHRREDPG